MMRKNYLSILTSVLVLTVFYHSYSQCGSPVSNGSASNMFTLIRNSTNPIAADKNLNTVVFIHRNNATAFGGNSGQLRYDVSLNGGATFTNDIGVLNPLTTNLARYPNVAIYNPTNNTNPANARVAYLAATINSATSAWNGVVSGSAPMGSNSNTENYNQPVTQPQLIAHSLVKGAPGVFWAIDALYNGATITGLTVYKGVWNSTAGDIVWSNNFTITPSFNTGLSSTGIMGDYNIAFDPTGTNGWISFLSHVTPGPTNYAYYPVFYKTTNGGTTWTGPIQVDLNAMGCMTSILAGSNVITTNFEHDLAVDVNGNPHLFTTICNGNNAYSVIYSQAHRLFDITLKSGMWVASDVSNVLAGRGTWGTSPNQIFQDMAPQLSRSADGTKLFFSWSDNTSYTLGQANQTPNLFGRALDITSGNWTLVKNFTGCNATIAGSIVVPHASPEALEPSSTVYKVPTVYGVLTNSLDPALVCNFTFLDNVTYSVSEFTVTPPPSPTISIVQGTNVLLCPSSTVNISLAPPYGQVLWSNGGTTGSIPISSPTISTYSVMAQKNCGIATASITVTNMSISAAGPSSTFCPGDSATFTVSGNALSYTWMPGNITGTSAVVSASSTTIYTVLAGSNVFCFGTATLGLSVWPQPTVNIAGNNTICLGSVVSLTASGANNYTWNPGGPNTAVANFTPAANISYTVLGDDLNGCQSLDSILVVVLPTPTVSAAINTPTICLGATVALTASGATTYSWSNGAITPVTTDTPAVNTIYTVVGTDTNLCTSSATTGITVYTLPIVVVTSSSPTLCIGEKAKLTATGAASYSWHTGASTSTLQIQPITTVVYTVVGTNTTSCQSTTNFTQTVSGCVGLPSHNAEETNLSIIPNPSSGSMIIRSDFETSILIYSELGQKITGFKLSANNGFEVNVTGLAPGIYFATDAEGRMRPQKIIVNN